MEKVFDIILTLIIFFGVLYGFSRLLGNGKGHIIIDFDKRHTVFNDYIKAIKEELIKQGRKVSYLGNRKFLIDGKTYIFLEKNISMGGAPLQRTVLKPKKQSN